METMHNNTIALKVFSVPMALALIFVGWRWNQSVKTSAQEEENIKEIAAQAKRMRDQFNSDTSFITNKLEGQAKEFGPGLTFNVSPTMHSLGHGITAPSLEHGPNCDTILINVSISPARGNILNIGRLSYPLDAVKNARVKPNSTLSLRDSTFAYIYDPRLISQKLKQNSRVRQTVKNFYLWAKRQNMGKLDEAVRIINVPVHTP